MAALAIRFFSPQENKPDPKKSPVKAPVLTGFISASGKLVFASTTLEQLGIGTDKSRFLIGTQQGKRKVKSLYLIPATDDDTNAFTLVKGAKSYAIGLGEILQKNGLDYQSNKYSFRTTPFEYEAGITGYELLLEFKDKSTEIPEKTTEGKRRGRKPKAESRNA